ncbi:MAG: hypothetical protein IJ464_04845 [Alistipes sp.]|nr:hypothetical protein [Alistipes sp.]
MRKLLSIFSIALVAMFAIGCENDEQGGNNGHTLNFGEPTVTSSTIEVGIVPSDTASNYFAGIVAASELAGKDDSAIITEYIQKLTMFTGVQFITAKNLQPETDYTAIAFYMGETAKVTKLNIRTNAPGAEDDPFSLTLKVTNVTHNSAIVTATPTRDDVNYFFRVITELELKESGCTTPKQIMEYCISNPSHIDYVAKGERTIESKNLAAKFKYIAVAFNTDLYDDMIAGIAPIEIFQQEFTTLDAPEVDPDTLFLYENLNIGVNTFSLDVTPVKGEDKLWSYYIFQKQWYDNYIASSRNAVVMRAYLGLYGLRQEYCIAHGIPTVTFNEFVTSEEYMGHYGSKQITAYENLRPASDYVVAMFYMSPDVTDPTDIYDYEFVAVEFTTKEADANIKVKMDVQGPVVEKTSTGYNVKFNVAIDNNAIVLRYGATEWTDNVAQWYDPEDCNSIRAFIVFRTSDENTFAAAKTEAGATFSFETGVFDGIIMFEAENVESERTQYMARITPDMFE